MLFGLVDVFCAILALRMQGREVPICVLLYTMECKYVNNNHKLFLPLYRFGSLYKLP